MSLDVTIKYKEPKIVNYNRTHTACGSTIAIVPDNYECEETEWSANITRNMHEMASHVPVSYKHNDGEWYDNYLSEVLWNPEDYKMNNTSIMVQALASGVSYMVMHKGELLQYNPENGWGSYDAFLDWLIIYWKMCDENPDCEIETY